MGGAGLIARRSKDTCRRGRSAWVMVRGAKWIDLGAPLGRVFARHQPRPVRLAEVRIADIGLPISERAAARFGYVVERGRRVPTAGRQIESIQDAQRSGSGDAAGGVWQQYEVHVAIVDDEGL